MATDETRQIKGWRSRMEDEAAELRRRVWQAPSETVRHEGLRVPLGGDLVGHTRWFHREFGEERAFASAELKRFNANRRRIEQSEWSDEKREAVNTAKRAWYAAQSDDWYTARLAQNRAWKARQSPESRAKINASIRTWRAKQSDEWREAEAAKKRARRAAKPQLYKAIEKRHEELRRDRRNAQRREAYALAPELYRTQRNERRAANRKRARSASAKQG